MPEPRPLLRTFAFQVKLLRSPSGARGGTPEGRPSGALLCDGAFQECSGLEIEMDVQEYLEGGRNDGIIRRIGRAKFPNIVLKRGMIHERNQADRTFWTWMLDVVAGNRPMRRYDGIVEVMTGDFGAGNTPVATWVFDRGLPAKIVGPQLNAKTGEVAIEELHIAHEGLRLLPSVS